MRRQVGAVGGELELALHSDAVRGVTMKPIAVVFLLLSGCMQSPEVDVQTDRIIGGTRTTGDPGVVLLVASFGNGYSMCTAEVVSAHVVMTAAHCVDPSETGPVQRFDIFLGDDFDDAQQSADPKLWIKVKETHFDPKFDGQQLGNGHDVAVVILDKPSAIPPLRLNHTPLSQAHMGQPIRLVGYGVINGWTQQGSGKKRVTSTPLTDYDQSFITFGDSQKGTCQGDSGGPAFMMIGGVEQIVGVTSFGDQGCQQGGWDTRVDTIGAPFVDPYIAMHDPPSPMNPGGGSGGGTAGGAPPRLSPNPDELGRSDVAAEPAAPGPEGHDPAACGGGCSFTPASSHDTGLLIAGYFFLLILSRKRRDKIPPKSDASTFLG